jgi:hypothetical protein
VAGEKSRYTVGGPAHQAVTTSLAAWIADGDLADDSYAAVRGVLLDAAIAVDTCRAEVEAGEASGYQFARTVALLQAALDNARRGTAGVGDDVDDFIASLGSGPS